MKKKSSTKKEVVIYQAKSGAIELRGDFSHETVWATQAKIAEIFGVTTQNITMHLRNIYEHGELQEKATCKEFLQVQTEGGRSVNRRVKEYNLDILIAVGYRINSVIGTRFRQWATKVLKKHIVEGYTINRKRIEKNYEAFLGAVEDVRRLLPENVKLDTSVTLDLVKLFASTWFSLDAYDKERLPKKGATRKQVIFTAEEFIKEYNKLKFDWEGGAGNLFGMERTKGSIQGIIGNIYQSFDGADVYKTVEEKAAHLLYFMVKNHPFVDGNKRIGAFAFVWFIKKAKIFDSSRLSPDVLTILTVLVASSNPKEKERIIGLILNILNA